MNRILLSSLLAATMLPTACSRKIPSAVTAEATPAAAEAPAIPATAEAAATPETAGGNRPGGGGGNGPQRAEERMQRMKTEVGLTDDQVEKIRAINEAQFASLRQPGGYSSMSREDRRAAFQKAREAANAEIEPLLTAEQKPKWEAFQQQQQQEMEARRNAGGGQGNGEGRRQKPQ